MKYTSAPLPFVGQKRMFVGEYKTILRTVTNADIFVDLFGGSGLLSHVTKHERPDATVVYNDYDNYRQRIAHIGNTNRILSELRELTKDTPWHKLVPAEIKEKILRLLVQREKDLGYIDYITLSSSLLFSMKYVLSIDGFRKESMYNNIRKNDYDASGYLDGLEITNYDYMELFERYRGRKDVIFLVDPPYLSTDVGTYKMSWTMADYLNVIKVLNGHRFIYFTSNKSSIIELCEWIGRNRSVGNPFEYALRKEFNARVNYSARYTDIMLYNVD